MPEDANAQDTAHRLLHTLWGRAVGTPGYVKDDWQALQEALQDLKPILRRLPIPPGDY